MAILTYTSAINHLCVPHQRERSFAPGFTEFVFVFGGEIQYYDGGKKEIFTPNHKSLSATRGLIGYPIYHLSRAGGAPLSSAEGEFSETQTQQALDEGSAVRQRKKLDDLEAR